MKKIKLPKNFYIYASGFLLLAAWFYWYEFRPSQIKKECSWKTVHIDAVSGISPLLKSVTSMENCDKAPDKAFCENRKKVLLSDRNAKPARDETRLATSTEYSACIHSKGL